MTGSQMKQWEIYFRHGISTAPAELMPSASKAQGSSMMIIFDDIDDFRDFDYYFWLWWWSVKAGLWGQGKSRISSEIMGRVPGEESINKYPIISVNTRLFLAALAPHLNFENLSLTSCDAILLVQDSSFLELWQRSKKWDFNKKAFHVVFAPYKEIWRLSHSVCWIYFQVQATFSCSKSMSRAHQISSKHAN